jgi:3-hydroxy-9,10-secoandrosta-1,3,5(10)-triene-9,17-dione monooxygenase reductase component
MSADLSAPSPEALRDVFARFPTGVAVVCARDSEGVSGGMTANAICSLSLDPLLVLVCFQREARTLPLVERAGRFSISVLEAGRGDLAKRFASREIEESDKLEGVPFSEVDGLPVLDAAIAWTVCSVRELLPGGDHTIAIGEVESLGSREGDPLVWHRGSFTGLEPADSQ